MQFRPEPLGRVGLAAYDSNGNNLFATSPEFLDAFQRVNAALGQRDSIFAELQEAGDEDMSLQGALGLAGWRARTALEEFAEYIAVDLAYAYQSNDIGFRANTILEQARADFGDIQGISGLVVTDPRGYVHIANCFSEQFMEENDTRLHLNTVVTRINWGDDCVCATVTEKGGSEREYCGSYAIVTFSIGVLQSDIVEFVPSPPRSWLITLHRAIMIPFLRAHIQFNETFWDTNVDFIMYVDEDRPRGYYAAFIPEGAYLEGNPPIVTALLGDPHAFRVAHQDPEITRREVSEVMRNIYGDRASEAIAVSVTDFIPSPYFRGNVGRPTPGFTERSYDILAGPLGRMYFAGDGTILRHHSTAHGAFISGGETAERILQDIADRAACK